MKERITKVTLRAVTSEYIEGMRRAADETQRTGTAAQKLAQQREALQTLGGAMVAFGGAITATGVAALKTGIQYNTLQQTTRAALTTLLGSAVEANKQMDKLDEFARSSPFSKSVFIQAQQQMLGFGVATKDVLPALDAIQNAVAAMGGNNEQIAALAEIMARIKSEGRLSGDALQRLGYYGIDAAEIIGSRMNKTAFEIRDMAGKPGGIPVDRIWDPLVGGLQDKFGGAAANVKNTFEGALDRMKAAWRDLSSELASSLVDPQGGGGLVGLLNFTADVMRNFQKLPEPVKAMTTVVVGLAGAVALAGGTFLLAVPKIAAFRAAMDSLNLSGRRLASTVGKGSLLIMALATVSVALSNIGAQAKLTEKDVALLNASLEKGGDDVNALFTGMQGTTLATNGVAEALAKLRGGGFSQWWNEFNTTVWDGVDGVLGWIPAIDDLHNGMKKNEAQFKALGDTLGTLARDDLGEAAKGFARLVAETDGSDESIRGLLDLMPGYEAALIELAAASGVTLSEQEMLNAAMGRGEWATKQAARESKRNAGELELMGKAAADASKEVDGLADAIRKFGSLTLDARAAEREFRDAVDDLTESIAENGTTLDINTEAGRKNEAALDALAKSALDMAAAKYQQTGSENEARKAIEEGRQALLDQLQAFGITGEAASAYADELGLIPSNVITYLELRTEDATARLKLWLEMSNGVVAAAMAGQRYQAYADALAKSKSNADGGFYDYAFANGGTVSEGMYLGGRPIYKFAEPETGWETFVSGRPGMERQNFGYALEAMMRLSRQMGISLGAASAGSSVDQSVHAPITVRSDDPALAAEFVSQRIGTYLAVRR